MSISRFVHLVHVVIYVCEVSCNRICANSFEGEIKNDRSVFYAHDVVKTLNLVIGGNVLCVDSMSSAKPGTDHFKSQIRGVGERTVEQLKSQAQEILYYLLNDISDFKI